jgi:hypothetical protein
MLGMSESRVGSQRAFVAVTLITVLAVTAVFVVYAVILSTINGTQVNVVGFGGSMWYDEANSADPADWTATLPDVATNGSLCDPWYSKINITSAGYSGAVTVTWTLQYDSGGGNWLDVGGGATQSTSFTLTGSAGDTIYASTDGTQGGNMNWGAYSATADQYRVRAVIES